MAGDQLNRSRRALLGAAVGLVARAAPVESRGSPHVGARASGEEWARALGAFGAAEAALRTIAQASAGGSFEAEEALEGEYDRVLDAHHAALRRLLRLPAPDLPALALKIALTIDHEVATLSGGGACLAALRRDAQRLAAAGRGGPSA
jgi:hypothetical protein